MRLTPAMARALANLGAGQAREIDRHAARLDRPGDFAPSIDDR